MRLVFEALSLKERKKGIFTIGLTYCLWLRSNEQLHPASLRISCRGQLCSANNCPQMDDSSTSAATRTECSPLAHKSHVTLALSEVLIVCSKSYEFFFLIHTGWCFMHQCSMGPLTGFYCGKLEKRAKVDKSDQMRWPSLNWFSNAITFSKWPSIRPE